MVPGGWVGPQWGKTPFMCVYITKYLLKSPSLELAGQFQSILHKENSSLYK
jgi:hypothetical protein